MVGHWGEIVKRYRKRYGLSQERMAAFMQVSQRTISRWECNVDNPGIAQQKKFRDLGLEPPDALLRGLTLAVNHCPTARYLTLTSNLRLAAISKPALVTRPSVLDWIGKDLSLIAIGVLEEMLDDTEMQKAISQKEVTGVMATTETILRTVEGPCKTKCRLSMSYFFHEGTLYSDSVAYPVSSDEVCGYTVFHSDVGFEESLEPSKP